MKILSLFDGMSCGMIALRQLGLLVESYSAYEIDKYAVQTSEHNFPEIKHCGDVFKADFTEYESKIDGLIGGSPCTYWSIAKATGRETTASGLGWELFSQYVRALKEAKPKWFLYENNKSMSQAIRDSIREAFGFCEICINSALVSAQNRQRFYWCGIRQPDGTYKKADIPQPEDRGILLKDIIATRSNQTTTVEPVAGRIVGRRISTGGHRDDENRSLECLQRFEVNKNPQKTNCIGTVLKDSAIAEPVNTTAYEKAYGLTANYGKKGAANFFGGDHFPQSAICEPVQGLLRIGLMPCSDGTVINGIGTRIYSIGGKSATVRAAGGGWGTKCGLYAVPLSTTSEGKARTPKAQYVNTGVPNILNRTFPESGCAEPVNCLSEREPEEQNLIIYASATQLDEKGNPVRAFCFADRKEHNVYPVKGKRITIKEKEYPFKAPDGYYIIRKLTVAECMKLQTVPDWFEFPVSETQSYRQLGNGWTVEVIMHLITYILKGKTEDSEPEQLKLF